MISSHTLFFRGKVTQLTSRCHCSLCLSLNQTRIKTEEVGQISSRTWETGNVTKLSRNIWQWHRGQLSQSHLWSGNISQSDLPPTPVISIFVISSETERGWLVSLLAVASQCVRLTSITRSRWRSPLCPGVLHNVCVKLSFWEHILHKTYCS